jgi:hypothetical protein
MLFPDDAHFDFALNELKKSIDLAPTVPLNPLPCDRWIARSCLQKAIRRAEPELAQRALANLFQYDRRATWRHLTIIALEDVGVANIDILTRIVAAQRNRLWRNQQGGDWPVMAELVRHMAVSDHCQAACDLLLRALNDPQLDADRATASDLDAPQLAQMLWQTPVAIETKAIAATALGGGLAEGQQFNDPCAVFDILAEAGRSSHVVETCRAAWRLSRNPMAMLLPVVCAQFAACDRHSINDDALPPVEMVDGVPGYALDQFTRRGNSVSRDLLGADRHLRDLLQAAGVPSSQLVRTVGDLIFLLEGGRVRRRLRWATGDELRRPHRWLPATGHLGPYLDQALRLVEAKARQIANLRREHLSTFAP